MRVARSRSVPARPSETVLSHFYRGELARSDTWRTRLDATTNWALTTAAAVVSLAFASSQASHVIVLVGHFLVWTFLMLEARRYRYYDLWIRRVRLLEEGFLLPALRDETPDPDALRELADVMATPRLIVPLADALGLRLRRAYAPIFLVLTAAWLVKIVTHPMAAASLQDVRDHAHVGPVDGAIILGVVGVATVLGLLVFARSFRRPLPSGELAPRRRHHALADLFRF
jgi:uncharacterized membrane protein